MPTTVAHDRDSQLQNWQFPKTLLPNYTVLKQFSFRLPLHVSRAVSFTWLRVITLDYVCVNYSLLRPTKLQILLHHVRVPIPVAARSRRASAVARLLGLPVRIPLETWMSFSCQCCLLSGKVSASGWSLVQRSSTECDVSYECER
jgi:hypothetical protein